MARQTAPVEVNKFTGGLMTDASPLTSPDNYSLDEVNIVLNIDGSRQRRLGMDFEDGSEDITTNIDGTDPNIAITSYKWKNVAGNPLRSFLVVQVGNQVEFFDVVEGEALSSNLLHTHTFTTDVTDRFSFSVVDGLLVVATGQKTPTVFEFTAPSTFTTTTITLKIRDLFGVEDKDGSVDLFSGSDLQRRPSTLTETHTYNLRNQSWGVARLPGNGEDVADPIEHFRSVYNLIFATTKNPSNADTVNQSLYPDTQDPENRTISRFFASDVIKNPIGSTKSAQGYFIIDALERGPSRLVEDATNRELFDILEYAVDTLPADTTPGGPKVVSEFAGRIFYGGFSGDVIDGDSMSPKMSSYVLFSRLVQGLGDIALCYQDGDPTSKDFPDIVDTDGGFIRINEAYDICELISIGDGLIVIAANGVWRIVGGTDKGFTATNYIVEKLSDRGCTNPETIVVAENTVMYWGPDAIYHIKPDQYGVYGVQNISLGRIQKLFNSISEEDKSYATGEYDGYERKIRWIFANTPRGASATQELVFDLALNAFYVNRIGQLPYFPRVVSMFVTSPYTAQKQLHEIGYVTITQLFPVVKYSFSYYKDTTFYDWKSFNGVGVDAEGYMVTNFLSGGDFQRHKQVPYITVYLRKTETGFTEDENGDLVPVNSSSCILQSMWEWTNSANSGRWGRPFQAYRHRRQWAPTSVEDIFDDGNLVVVTKNKLRGGGRVLSLKFSTEPGKDFHLDGWSIILSVSNNV